MLKNRLSKLEKIQRDRKMGSGGNYLVITDGKTMTISSRSNQLYSGAVEDGEKMIKELDTPESYIVRITRG